MMANIDRMGSLFETHYEMLSSMGGRVKDFTSVVYAVKYLLKRLEIVQQILDRTKEISEHCSKKELRGELMKKQAHLLKRLEKRMKIDDSNINVLLFKLPSKKGKKYFELMKEVEEITHPQIKDSSKQEKINDITTKLKEYIEEINKVNNPFIPAKVDNTQTITFKVAFKYNKRIWRKIEMKATQTLEQLHDSIQNAIGWDNDHLYSFFMDNKFYSREPDMEYTCPFESEGRKTADVKVGVFGFEKGKKIAYLFDFGDDHCFEVGIVDFGKIEKGKNYPAVVESKGKPPEQYPE